ncbi:restriction endonuclease [Fusobacterium pseudoperiodonticum]|uniref:Restriction endonuclease n=1 Tax=Fusobacterium pseudoperiodonticum TaxID=2663009 RepID=A0AAD0AQH8_9FUSO|nr:restriction endonuclease subunit S [Fusobacterium pseudoperiodonticum]ATV65750.1 restriction endonuclease [Fusobacterium pseudoperiodonticum]
MKNKIKLGDLVNIKTGKLDANAAVDNGKYPFFTTSEETFKIDTYAYDDEAVLVAGNGNLNIKYFYGKFNAYQRTYILTKKENINVNIKYIYYFLDKYLETLRSLSIGGVIKYIKLENLINPVLDLPTIEVQNKIVEKLDTFKKILDMYRKKIDILSDFNKSLFTRMFGDIKTNDKNWEIKKFNEVISILTDYHANGSYKILKNNVELLDFKDYALMVRTTDLENNNFIQGVKYINEKAYNFLKKTKIFGGEIIINKIGSAGNVYLMPLLNRPVSLGMNQFMIRLKEDFNNIFYYKLLTTEYYTNVIKNNIQGAVTKTITKDAIKNIDIIVPPIKLQNIFAERVEKIEKLKFEIEKSIETAQNLYDSLISKYFDN